MVVDTARDDGLARGRGPVSGGVYAVEARSIVLLQQQQQAGA
jgi:hypothetical protein